MPVDLSGTGDVAVVLAAGEQVGEGQLLDRRRAGVERRLLGLDLVDQVHRHAHPADPDPRRERLRRRTEVHDATRVQPLDRADRDPVVAELGVVVVLDDEPVATTRPGDELGPAIGRHHGPRRELVGRRHEHRVPGGLVESVGPQTAVVDRHRLDRQTGSRDGLPRVRLRRGLARDRPRTAGTQHPAQDVQRLGEALRDDDPLRLGADAADPAEIVAQRRPELRTPAVVAIVERRVGRRAHRPFHGSQPRPAREQLDVRGRRHEVDRPRRALGLGGQRRWRRDRHHDRRLARGDGQVALGRELVVRVGHHAARDLQVRREPARGRQPRARAQASILDRFAQRTAEVAAQRSATQLDVEVHVATARGRIEGADRDRLHDASDASAGRSMRPCPNPGNDSTAASCWSPARPGSPPPRPSGRPSRAPRSSSSHAPAEHAQGPRRAARAGAPGSPPT